MPSRWRFWVAVMSGLSPASRSRFAYCSLPTLVRLFRSSGSTWMAELPSGFLDCPGRMYEWAADPKVMASVGGFGLAMSSARWAGEREIKSSWCLLTAGHLR